MLKVTGLMYVIAGYAHEQGSVTSGRAGGANNRV